MGKNIEVIKDHGNWRVFGTTCECTGHGMQVTVEYDEIDGYKSKQLELSFETRVGYWEKTYCYDWKKFDFWYERLWKIPKERLRRALRILFLGECEHSETFIFRGSEHVKDLIQSIIAAHNSMCKDDIWHLLASSNQNKE